MNLKKTKVMLKNLADRGEDIILEGFILKKLQLHIEIEIKREYKFLNLKCPCHETKVYILATIANGVGA